MYSTLVTVCVTVIIMLFIACCINEDKNFINENWLIAGLDIAVAIALYSMFQLLMERI